MAEALFFGCVSLAVDRGTLIRYHYLLFETMEREEPFLRKACGPLLLGGFFLLAGCGGIHNQVQQSFFSPPRAQLFEELSLFPSDNADRTARVFPGNHPLPEIQLADLIPSPKETEVDFCFPGQDPLDQSESQPFELPGSAYALLRKGSDAASWEKGESGTLPPDSTPDVPLAKSSSADGIIEGISFAAENPLPGQALPPASAEPFEVFSERMREIFSQHEMAEAFSPSPLSPDPSLEIRVPQSEARTIKLSVAFPKLLNERVKTYIDFFQSRADQFFTKSLARSQAYEGIIRPILREKNLPEELLYLALIESGYNPHAQSRAKATGIWQFMNGTAKRFGLRVDSWIDERRDPEKSTLAAADYLKSLYEMFNCWYLAAAGYNAGEAKIFQAMKRAKSQDFWAISQHRYLKRETKDYVPKLLAAMIIAEDPVKYGLSNIDYHPALVYEKVAVPPGVRLDQIARAAETNVEELRVLNPALRRDKTPPQDPSFEIKLPPGKKEAFEKNFSQMFKLDPRTSRKHLVRQGDTLGQIAKKYRVDLPELCQANGITAKTPIKPGMTLLLPP